MSQIMRQDTSKTTEPYTYRLSTLERGLKIMELLGDEGPLSVSQVANQLGMHRSVSHRFLAALRELGYLAQDASSCYRLSFLLFELGMKVVNALGIRQVASPFMEELATISRETVNLAHLNENRIIYIDKILSQEPFRMDFAVGSRVPAHCTALGKAILAFRPEKEREAFLQSKCFEALTPNTVTTAKKLAEEFEKIRQKGFAVDDEEFVLGCRCIAVPIFDYTGYPLNALSVAGPKSRMSNEKLEELQRHVIRVGANLSSRMGHRG